MLQIMFKSYVFDSLKRTTAFLQIELHWLLCMFVFDSTETCTETSIERWLLILFLGTCTFNHIAFNTDCKFMFTAQFSRMQ